MVLQQFLCGVPHGGERLRRRVVVGLVGVQPQREDMEAPSYARTCDAARQAEAAVRAVAMSEDVVDERRHRHVRVHAARPCRLRTCPRRGRARVGAPAKQAHRAQVEVHQRAEATKGKRVVVAILSWWGLVA